MSSSVSPVTAREFEAAMEALRLQMQAGFAQVNGRLDKVNGRVGRNDDAIAELRPRVAADGVRLKNLEREVFQRSAPRDDDAASTKKRDAIAIEIPMNAKTISVLLLAVAGLVTALITLLVRGGA